MLWAGNVVFVCNTESIFLCVSTSEAEPPLLHITTLTTAEGTPFSESMDTALCDFWCVAPQKNTYLLTYAANLWEQSPPEYVHPGLGPRDANYSQRCVQVCTCFVTTSRNKRSVKWHRQDSLPAPYNVGDVMHLFQLLSLQSDSAITKKLMSHRVFYGYHYIIIN